MAQIRRVDYDIKTPIWGTRSVGIADFRLKRDSIVITISWKDQFGTRVYPDKYFMTCCKAKQYPTKEVPAGGRTIKLHIIPICDFEICS